MRNRTTGTPPTAAGWFRFFRWGPYGLLALSVLATAPTTSALMSPAQVVLAGALVVTALFWQLVWDRRLRTLPEHTAARGVYFAVRTAVAFALCWLNPFFSIFALMGYFDAARNLAPRYRRWGLLTIAVALAGSQGSVPDGPPPDNLPQLVLVLILLTLHSSLAIGIDRMNDREAADRRKQENLIAELADTNARLQRTLRENAALHERLLHRARESGVTAERRRLVTDLHDILVQGLTGVVTQLQAGLDNDGPTARAHVEQAMDLARHSLREARRSVHDLTPGPLVRRSLPEALRDIVARWSSDSAVQARFTLVGTVEPLHAEIEAVLLRIAEEALVNVRKHAQANRVGVTLSYIDDEVTLDVRDDGTGFDPAAVSARSEHGGFGLDGMRMRAARVFGVLEVESEIGGGTAVSVRVPSVGDGT